MSTKPNIDLLIAKRFLRKGDVVIDGGAHNGDTAAMFLSLGASRVYAFEPVQELRELIYSRKLGAGCFVISYALSDEVRLSAALLISMQHDYGSTLNTDIAALFPEVLKTAHERSVSTLSIDSIPLSNVDYVKLDIEGSEPAALRGASKLYHSEHPPRVTVCELYPPVREEGLSLLLEYHDCVSRAYISSYGTLVLIDCFRELPDDCIPCPPMFVGWNE